MAGRPKGSKGYTYVKLSDLINCFNPNMKIPVKSSIADVIREQLEGDFDEDFETENDSDEDVKPLVKLHGID